MRRAVKLLAPDGTVDTEAIVVTDDLGVAWRPASGWYTDAAGGWLGEPRGGR